MGLALAALGHGGTAVAQVAAIQGAGVVDAGSASIDSVGGTTAAPRTNVQVFSNNAVINWTPTDAAAGATPIDFLPAGGLAYFYSSNPDFIVLNRVIPATTRQIGLNGTVQSNRDISGTTSPGGNVWFYSPTGFVAGTGSRFSTNGLILTANDIPYTPGSSAGGINFGPNGEIQMTAATAGSQANITLLPGSRITNTGTDAYTLIVAPQIVQGGTIELDGSVGLIAAESVSVLIQNGLFDIDVQVGTTVANAITHTGSTGAGPTGATLAGPQQTLIMATPDSTANTALTVLLGGNLGATSVNATAADRSVILSGGYDYKGASGTGFEPDPDTTTPVNFQFGTTSFNADLTAQTTGSIIGNPSRGMAINFLGNASLTAGTSVALTADLDETITASGNLFMKAPTSATITLGTTNSEAGAGNGAARLDVAGDLTLSADTTAPPPTAATGGVARITLEAGAVGPQMTVTGNTLVTAVGTGQSPTGDGDGGAGFGGTAEILVNGGTLTLSDAIVRAGGIGADGRAGNGGTGQGGTVSITASGGTLSGTTITADLSGRGGNADFASTAAGVFTAGTGQGGTFNLLIDGGAVTLTSLDVAANGFGGLAFDAGFNSFAGNPGQGIGGTATVTATAGSLSVPSLSLSANGQGGAAGSGGSFGTSSAAGAQGTGGGAAIDIGGASFTTSTITLHADGIGGNGADNMPAGSGTGGLASLIATDAGAYSLGDVTITANGQAGDSNGPTSPADGVGTGGTARFVNQGGAGAAAGSRIVGNLVIQANGNPGNFGGILGNSVAGFARFSDLSTGANGHARYASVLAHADGQSALPGSGVLAESAGGATAIDTSLDLGSVGNVTIAVTGNAPINAGTTVDVFSVAGDIVITHAGQGSPLFQTLTGSTITIDAGQNLRAGPQTVLAATTDFLDLTARAGEITAGSLSAVSSLSVHALGNVALQSASTSGTVNSPGGGLIYITAGVDPEIGGPYLPADITIGGLVNAGGELVVHAGRDILGSGPGPALLEGEVVRLIGERDISGSQLSVRSRGDLFWLIGRNLLLDTVDVAGQINMSDLSGLSVLQAGQLNVNGSVGINSLILRGPTAGLVRATGNLTIGKAFTTGLDVATPGGVLTLGGLQAYPGGPSGFLTASAPTLSLAEINVSGAINAAATAGALTISNLTAGGAIGLTAQTDIAATNLLQGSTVTVTAPGAMSFGTVNVTAGDFSAAPGGALSLQNATVSGAITLGGTSVTLGSAQAGNQLLVTTPGTFTANGQVSAPTVRVSSSDVVIGANGRIGAAGTTSLVQLTNNDATRRTYYGGAGNAAGYSLSGAEMGQLYGASITLIAPQTAQSSGAVPDVTIGDMTVTGAQLGAQGSLTILTPGRVLINGAAKFTGLTNANTFSISAGQLIALDTQAGAVDLRGTGTTLAGRIDFSANTIVAASSAARTALAGLTDPVAIDTVLGSNDGNLRTDGVLAADSMRFSVSNGLYIQNTGTSTFFPLRRGFTVGAGGFAVSTPVGRTTPVIVINGQATTSAGTSAFGLEAIPLVSINGQPAPTSSGSAAGSTINGCDFTKVDECRPPLTPELTLTRDRVQSPVEENSDKPSDLAVERQSLVTPGVELLDIGRFSYEPLIDEPVTGSGNDDLWVPGCDSSKGNCPAP